MIVGPLRNSLGTKAARVWLDELPGAVVEIKAYLRFQSLAAVRDDDMHRILAVEMAIYTDKQQYGLLGAAFTPNPSGTMDCTVPIIEDQGEFAGSIAPAHDRVRWFFPAYFAEACKKAILASSGLPSGTLELKCAASADVGSSQVMFAHLTRVVITAVRDRLNADAIIDLAFEHNLGGAYAILKGETGGRRA